MVRAFAVAVIAIVVAVVCANDAFRDAAQAQPKPQPQPAAALPQNLAVERDLQAQKQSNVQFEHQQQLTERDLAIKRAVEEQRLALVKAEQDKQERIKKLRADLDARHAADTRALQLQERHNFWAQAAKDDQAQFFRQNPPRNNNGAPQGAPKP